MSCKFWECSRVFNMENSTWYVKQISKGGWILMTHLVQSSAPEILFYPSHCLHDEENLKNNWSVSLVERTKSAVELIECLWLCGLNVISCNQSPQILWLICSVTLWLAAITYRVPMEAPSTIRCHWDGGLSYDSLQ